MDKLTKVLLKNRAIVVFFLFIIVGIGIYSYYVIPKQENPDTTIAVAVVSTIYPGGAPEDVEKFVTEKLETEIGKLEKVDYYTSMSMDSASVIIIYYEDSVLMEDVIDDLRQTVEDVQGSLPDTCMASEVNTDLISNSSSSASPATCIRRRNWCPTGRRYKAACRTWRTFPASRSMARRKSRSWWRQTSSRCGRMAFP